jgi:hypothetical protein
MADDNDDITSGFGVTVEVETGAGTGVFTEIGLVHEVTLAGDTVAQFDKSHMKSPGGRKEYGNGMIDGGEGGFNHNWGPGNDTHNFMNAWLAARDTRIIRYTYPSGDREAYPANLTGWQRTAPMEDRMTGAANIKKAGDVTWDTV